jgi:hypothetical protein
MEDTMGTGLSELQKGLLLMALANTGRCIGERERGFIKRLQIKDTRELPHLTTHEALQGRNHASARTSISQAFSRLEKRGLVRKDYQYKVRGPLLWSGIDNPLSLTYSSIVLVIARFLSRLNSSIPNGWARGSFLKISPPF